MDLKSEPEYRTEWWTDLDICFPEGIHQLTLREGDKAFYKVDTIDIEFNSRTPREEVTIYLKDVRWKSIRVRLVRIPVKPAQEAPAPAPVSPPTA